MRGVHESGTDTSSPGTVSASMIRSASTGVPSPVGKGKGPMTRQSTVRPALSVTRLMV